ncbi:MAG: DUF4416 family protein [Phycisphaerae bacterium]|nr:DUF4416 family protein [Phycisphaerae bacterium]
MATISKPDNAKLICGMISSSENLFDCARKKLEASYGQVSISSDTLPFDSTNYYFPQMGGELMRKFVAFERPIDPGELVDIKRATNELEDTFAAADGAMVARPINLDPGYVTLHNLVLASMKNFSHRIYLNRGVFAEVTLIYHNGWNTLDWTFPDYGSGAYFPFLTATRNLLRDDIKQEKSQS